MLSATLEQFVALWQASKLRFALDALALPSGFCPSMVAGALAQVERLSPGSSATHIPSDPRVRESSSWQRRCRQEAVALCGFSIQVQAASKIGLGFKPQVKVPLS